MAWRLTDLQAVDARLGPQVGQVDVGLTPVDDGVGLLARAVRANPVRHRHLHTQTDTAR